MATDKIQIGLRVPDDLREKIQSAASERGISVNKEITDRLVRSFSDEIAISADGDSDLFAILRVVAAAMDLAGPMSAIISTLNADAGKQWTNNSIAYEQAVKAAITVLEAFRPRTATTPHPKASDTSTFGVEMAAGILEEAATGLTRMPAPAENARATKLRASIGSLVERIAHFDARDPNNDPGAITIRLFSGLFPGTARLIKAPKNKGKRK